MPFVRLPLALFFFSTLCLLIGPNGAQAASPQEVDTAAVDLLAVEAVPDSALAARLRQVFAQIDDFTNVQVAVNGGVVRLTGTALGGKEREQAADLAARFEGVVFVDNDIEEETDVETRVAPAFQKVQAFWDTFVRNLPVAGVALLVLLFFGFLSRLLGKWKAPFHRLGVPPLLQSLIRRVLRAVVFVIGLVLALEILDVTTLVGAVLGAAGVIGLALGFAFQDIVENYLAGILLSIRQPFNVGDLITVESHEGRVIRMSSRELILMTVEGNHVRLPNALVFKNPLINYTRNPRRRFDFAVGVDVDEDLTRAQQLGVDTLRAMKGVMDDPGPGSLVEELGESTVNVRFLGWVDQTKADFLKVKSEAIRLVKTHLDDAGVQMPEPIYRVRLQQIDKPEKAAPAPTRPSQRIVPEEAREVDVAPDDALDEQIAEDLATDEQNLLE